MDKLKQDVVHSLYRAFKVFVLGGVSVLLSSYSPNFLQVMKGTALMHFLNIPLIMSFLAGVEKFLNQQIRKEE